MPRKARLNVPGTVCHVMARCLRMFAYTAVKEYHAPSRMVADYCDVGQAAISALAKAGREIVFKENQIF